MKKGYKDSHSARNQAVGEVGKVAGYSNSLPGLIKRVEGIGDRIDVDEEHIGGIETMGVGNSENLVEAVNLLATNLGGVQFDLVYTNPNPNENFNGDLVISPDYDSALIVTQDGDFLVNKGTTKTMRLTIAAVVTPTTYIRYYTRNVIYDANGTLTFLTCSRMQISLVSGEQSANTESNNTLVPYLIYGIRKKTV